MRSTQPSTATHDTMRKFVQAGRRFEPATEPNKRRGFEWSPCRVSHLCLLLLAGLAVSTQARAQTVLHSFPGEGVEDWFGYSVSGSGDVNADGFADIIVGAFESSFAGAGYAKVLSGLDGSTLYRFDGAAAGDEFGRQVTGAGDMNLDGFADFAVAAGYATSGTGAGGTVTVFSGFDGSVLYAFGSNITADRLGFSLSHAGDVNGDGRPDLIASSRKHSINGTNTGRARVFSGLDGSTLYSFNGDAVDDGFGSSVSGAGDVNNDGFHDLIVGAEEDDDNGLASGSARVFSGFDGSVLYTFLGDASGDSFGRAVSGAGDVNGDGFDDLIAGATGTDFNGDFSGSARVFSGLDGSILFTVHGDGPFNYLGRTVSGAGDINGDGFDDIIVGAHGAELARLYSGFDGSILFTLSASAPSEWQGSSVGAAGDVNGDGAPDVIVGAFRNSTPGFEFGIARVYSGVPLPIVFPDLCNGDGGDQLGCTNCPCGNNSPVGTVGGCLNSTLAPGRLELTGGPSVTLPTGSTLDLRASLTGTAPGAFSLLVSGAAAAPGNPANPCFGMQSGAQAAIYDGLRCAVMDVRRHGGRVTDANGEVGANTPPWGGEGHPQAGLAQSASFVPGQNRYFQAIYRDFSNLSCMTGLNTTQSIRVVFQP